jgi:hypothetical protein
MLVSKTTYNENDIVTFKLVNGDEVIAKVVAEKSDCYEIENPATVIPSQQGLGLLNSLFTSSPTIKVSLAKSHVMLHALTVSPWTNHYIKATTGVEIATAGDIIV